MPNETMTASEALQKMSADILGSVLSVYTTMIYGQIVANDKLPMEEKIAALICASDVLTKAHSQAIIALCGSSTVSPAWMIPPDKIVTTAQLYARRMSEGG